MSHYFVMATCDKLFRKIASSENNVVVSSQALFYSPFANLTFKKYIFPSRKV